MWERLQPRCSSTMKQNIAAEAAPTSRVQGALASSSSTSNTSEAFGGMSPPAPSAP